MEGDLQKAVGRNLRRYREAHGLSQEKFAEAVGVHRTYMGGLERGERNLTLRSVEKLAAAIEVNPLDLMENWPTRGQVAGWPTRSDSLRNGRVMSWQMPPTRRAIVNRLWHAGLDGYWGSQASA